jgi:hypothetical protein
MYTSCPWALGFLQKELYSAFPTLAGFVYSIAQECPQIPCEFMVFH